MRGFSAGWDEDRIKWVLEHYEGQSESEAVSEEEATFMLGETLVQVPLELVVKMYFNDHAPSTTPVFEPLG